MILATRDVARGNLFRDHEFWGGLMNIRALFVLGLALALVTPATALEKPAATPLPPRLVMSWVPAYGIATSDARLRALYGGFGPRNALNHLGLQFWGPTTAGGVNRVTRYGTISNATIQKFVALGHANGIKVMLCVFNGENGWNWSLAKAAFATHQAAFISALIGQMQARGLDGIDVDLEGPAGNFEADKPAYVAFIKELARRVHLLGKQVTLDSFHYIYNAPNQNWWATLLPLVDGLTSMGYEDLARNAPEVYFRYLSQKTKAGALSRKLMIGMPSYLSSWKGNTALQQAQWFMLPAAGRVGIGIWDAQDNDPVPSAWRSAAVWKAIRAVRIDPN